MDSMSEAKTVPSLKSNIEESIDTLDETINRLDHQLAMLITAIGPVLRESYPTAEASEGNKEDTNHSIVDVRIRKAILLLQNMSYTVGQVIDRVDC